MATSYTIPTPKRDPFRGNLTLGSPFEQPGAAGAAPVPADAVQRLRNLTAQAPENEGIVGVMSGGTPLLTNRPEAARTLSDDDAFGAFDGMTAYGTPQEVLANYISGSKRTARTSRLDQAADEAFDAQQANQRVTAGARAFDREQRGQDIIANARATGQGETDAFLTGDARRMREERNRSELGLAEAKNAGPLADAQARMYAADRAARAREAAIPGQQIGAYADVLGATELMQGDQVGPLREMASQGIMQAGGQQTATEDQLYEFAESRGLPLEEARARARAAGFTIVP